MKHKLNFILLSILVVSIMLVVISTSLHYLSGGDVSLDYGITIDAGSSKTKFLLYDWKSMKENGTGYVKEKYVDKLGISIDGYADKLPELVKQLVSTLHKISNEIDYTRKQFKIPIYLGATAGMRLLKAMNNGDSDKILKEIRSSFEQYTDSQNRFQVENVEIITGEKEGLYCWISTNYLMGYVPPEDRPINNTANRTVGILDMGGASAQIAFETYCEPSSEDCKQEKSNLIANEKTLLFGTDYNIYTYSNLCFGNDDARRRYYYVVITEQTKIEQENHTVVDDPCTHDGQLNRTILKKDILKDVCTINEKITRSLTSDSYIFVAKPNIDRCQELTEKLVTFDYVTDHFTKNEEQTNFKIMEDSPPADMTFYALSTYFYTTSQLRKGEKNAAIHFRDEESLRKEIDGYCGRTWEDLIKDGNKDSEYLRNYCFSLNYMFNYLKKVYKFEGEHFSKIEFREKLNGQDLGWSLGYMLQATNTIPQGSIEDPILNTTQFVSITVVGLILLLGVLFVFLKTRVINQKVFIENDSRA